MRGDTWQQQLECARAVKKLLPDSFVFVYSNTDAIDFHYGWVNAFINEWGVLVKEWGGSFQLDNPEGIAQSLIEQNEYWVKQYGKELPSETVRGWDFWSRDGHELAL